MSFPCHILAWLLTPTCPPSQKKTKRGGKSTVVTYFCAQLEGEQSKSRTQDSDRKSRSRITRYHCGGWLRITVMDDNEHLLRIRMTHAEAHPSFPASFRRPPHTSEFKLETTPKPASVPVPQPQPPPPIFANMQHPPHLMVEPGPPAGLPIPPPPGPPPVLPTIPPLPPPHPDAQEEVEHPAVENVLAPEDVTAQATLSPVSAMASLRRSLLTFTPATCCIFLPGTTRWFEASIRGHDGRCERPCSSRTRTRTRFRI